MADKKLRIHRKLKIEKNIKMQKFIYDESDGNTCVLA
jgi:hypothetical protein